MPQLSKKQKLIKNTSRSYVFSRFLLFFSITLLVLTFIFIISSFLMTILNYIALHNSGKPSGEIWIEISHFWWSPIKVINESEYQPGESIFITFSIFSYVMMGLLGVGFITIIVSIVLVANMKSPKKIAPQVQTLDDDYWKRQITKIRRVHRLEIDAWQEYIEVAEIRHNEQIEELKKIKIKQDNKKK